MTRGLAIALACAACNDALDQRLAIVDQPRVLAVIAEPAEARPGSVVSYTAVVGAPDGPVTGSPSWAYCVAPKPPTTDNAVSNACLDPANLVSLGTEPSAIGTLPADGCLLYGPETPPGNFRPRDPDGTGGFYQTVQADVDGLVAFGLSRITCQLATATSPIAHDYQVRYVANQNPTIDPLVVSQVAADTDVTLTASWPATAVETYLYYDPLALALVTRREAMRLSWFATGGTLAVDASAVAESDPATQVSTTWHTPAAGTAYLWLVLRDSRGGIASQAVRVQVGP